MSEGRVPFTKFTGPDGSRLTKALTLRDDGLIIKDGTPLFFKGTARTRSIDKLAEIEGVIEGLSSNECLATGIFDVEECDIVTGKSLDEESQKAGQRSRSKDQMHQPSPGLVLFDHDPNPYMPEHLRCRTPGELMEKLHAAVPELARVAYSGTTSCSHGIKNRITGEAYPSGGGLHVYAVLENGQVSEFRRYLEVKQWNGGLGFIALSRNGAMLPRTLLDLSVLSHERLIYEARPVLGGGLAQAPREWQHHPGKGIAGDFSLTDDEIAEYERRVAEAKTDPVITADAERIQDEYRGEKIKRLAKHAGIAVEDAAKRIPRQSLADREHARRNLSPDDIVEIGGEQMTITELLARGAEFDNTAMPDPIEGRSYGMTTAKFYWNEGRRPCIHSFAHGLSTRYGLGEQLDFETLETTVADLVPACASASLASPAPLDRESFPHQRVAKSNAVTVPATIENVEHLLIGYGITVRYDVIKKKSIFTIPGHTGTPENWSNTSMHKIVSLAVLNQIPPAYVPNYVETIADRHQVNPVAEWIDSRPWDGRDRLPQLYATLQVRESFPEELKKALIYRWMLSAVAATLMSSGFRSRGVLTLQGPQGIGKTTWFANLVSDPKLREDYIQLGHHLDPGNKDSHTTAVTHWIVELGELDSSLKKDIARLKSLITSPMDKVRRPYARSDSEYPRRTVFCASVNESNFLIDATGNTRFWTIPVMKIHQDPDLDMQQIWAQLKVKYDRGDQWWLTSGEEALLAAQNQDFRAVSAIEERLLASFQWDMPEDKWTDYTATQALEWVGIEHPTNPQARECGAVLRTHVGEPRKIKGLMKWRLPLKTNQHEP